MIKKSIFIDERKVVNIMNSNANNIVNISEEGFQYCNGYMIVNCTYEHDLIIQNLFKIGALSNYKNWTPKKSNDFSKTIDCVKEIEAQKTAYLHSRNCGNDLTNIFKIGDNYYHFNKKYVDIFKDVTFKAGFSSSSSLPVLKAYNKDEFLGLILPVITTKEDMLLDILSN